MAFKMSQEFPTTSSITEDFHKSYTVLTHTFVIPSSKQKHTPGSLTHTHTPAKTTQKAAGHVTLLANGHLTGSDAPFECEIPTTSSDKMANGTKRTPSQNWGNLLSEQCLTGISDAFSAFIFNFYNFFTGIRPSSSLDHCTPNKSVPTLRDNRRHVPSAVPWISEDDLLFAGRVCKTTKCNDVIRIP